MPKALANITSLSKSTVRHWLVYGGIGQQCGQCHFANETDVSAKTEIRNFESGKMAARYSKATMTAQLLVESSEVMGPC